MVARADSPAFCVVLYPKRTAAALDGAGSDGAGSQGEDGKGLNHVEIMWWFACKVVLDDAILDSGVYEKKIGILFRSMGEQADTYT